MPAIPLLEAADIECRIQSISKNKSGKVGAILLLYKDARVDMRILDAVYGANNWQRTHEVINDNLFCNIDTWDDDKKCWVRKQDVGVESYTEKQKGQASDAFKRAGFNVGIGRELYTAPFIYIELSEGEHYESNGSIKCKTRFEVKEIGYNDRREINSLIISDNKGAERFKLKGQAKADKTPKTADKGQKQAVEAQNTEDDPLLQYVCEVCGAPFTSTTYNGKTYTAKEMYEGAKKRHGRAMCKKCALKYTDTKGGC